MALRISRSMRDRIVTDCVLRLPLEGCGVVSAKGRFIPLPNAAKSPERFAFDPALQLRVWQELDAVGDRVAIVYHSHPDSAARPSATDVLHARLHPGVHHVIVGPVAREPREFTSWQVSDRQTLAREDVEILDAPLPEGVF